MSQFADIFKAVKQPLPKAPITKSHKKIKSEDETQAVNIKPAESNELNTANEESTVLARTAKRTGKSSDPDYTQVLAYIRRATHKEVRKTLLDDETGKDFSDLMESLLSDWLSKQVDHK